MKIDLDALDFYQSYFIFGVEIAHREKVCHVYNIIDYNSLKMCIII